MFVLSWYHSYHFFNFYHIAPLPDHTKIIFFISCPRQDAVHNQNDALCCCNSIGQDRLQQLHPLKQSKKFYRKLTKLQRRQRQRRIPRCALLAPKESAWGQVYESGSDHELITMTGFDFETFHFIEPDFRYFYDRYSPYSKEGVIVALQRDGDDNVLKGCPRLMSAADGLGLVLTWTRTRGSTMVLELIFGMTQTSILDYLAFCTQILVHILKGKDDAKIKLPPIKNSRVQASCPATSSLLRRCLVYYGWYQVDAQMCWR